MDEQLKVKDIFGYGLGELANKLIFAVGASYLLLFYTKEAGLSLVSTSSILVWVYLASIAIDLLLGPLIDLFYSMLGKYRAFLYHCPLLLITALLLLFAVSFFSLENKVIYMVGSYSFFIICYSLVTIPYGALASTLTQHSHSRLWLGVSRMVATSVSFFVLLVLDYAHVNLSNLWYVLIVISLVSYVLYRSCYQLTQEQNILIARAYPSLKQSYQALLYNRSLWLLCLSSLGLLIANLSLNSAFLLYVQLFYEDVAHAYWLLTLQMVINCTIPVIAVYVVNRFFSPNKKKLFVIGCCSVLCGCALLGIFASAQGSNVGLAIIVFANIAGFSLAQTAMWALEADSVDYGEDQLGVRTAGLNYACFGIVGKIAQVLTSIFPALLFAFCFSDVSLYREIGLQATDFKELVTFVQHLMSSLPAIAIIVSLGAMCFYRDRSAIQQRVSSNALPQVSQDENATLPVSTPTPMPTSVQVDPVNLVAHTNETADDEFVSHSRYALKRKAEAEVAAKKEVAVAKPAENNGAAQTKAQVQFPKASHRIQLEKSQAAAPNNVAVATAPEDVAVATAPKAPREPLAIASEANKASLTTTQDAVETKAELGDRKGSPAENNKVAQAQAIKASHRIQLEKSQAAAPNNVVTATAPKDVAVATAPKDPREPLAVASEANKASLTTTQDAVETKTEVEDSGVSTVENNEAAQVQATIQDATTKSQIGESLHGAAQNDVPQAQDEVDLSTSDADAISPITANHHPEAVVYLSPVNSPDHYTKTMSSVAIKQAEADAEAKAQDADANSQTVAAQNDVLQAQDEVDLSTSGAGEAGLISANPQPESVAYISHVNCPDHYTKTMSSVAIKQAKADVEAKASEQVETVELSEDTEKDRLLEADFSLDAITATEHYNDSEDSFDLDSDEKENTPLSTKQILALLEIYRLGPVTLFKIAKEFFDKPCPSDEELELALPDRFKDALTQEQWQAAERCLELTQQIGAHCLNYWDSRYPQVLRSIKDVKKQVMDDQNQVQGKSVKDKDMLIPVIFYKGDLSLLDEPCIAILGSSDCEETACQASLDLAAELAKRGICIVSGLTSECHYHAHQGALSVEGKIIAVLDCGLDSIVEEALSLAQQIVDQGGLLLSIYKPDEGTTGYRLRDRDFLMAGIVQASIMIAATDQIYSLNAAKATALTDKSLYVVEYDDYDLEQEYSGNQALAEQYQAEWIEYNDSEQLDKIADSLLKTKLPVPLLENGKKAQGKEEKEKSPLSTRQILALLRVHGIGPVRLFLIAEKFFNKPYPSNEEVEQALSTQFNYLLTEDDWQAADNCLALTQQIGAHCLNYWQSCFPQVLRSIKDVKNQVLGKRAVDRNMPIPVIFYQGDLSLLNETCVAILGSSEGGETAKRAGAFVAEYWAKKGLCIVSTLDSGCDSSALQAALQAKGKVIAVLGNGLNSLSDEESALARQIVAQGGLVLSEYQADESATNYRLRDRYFLIAGIAQICLVSAATEQSDALCAAKAAALSHKSLYVMKYDDLALNQENTGNQELATQYLAQWIKYGASTYEQDSLRKQLDAIAEQLLSCSLPF